MGFKVKRHVMGESGKKSISRKKSRLGHALGRKSANSYHKFALERSVRSSRSQKLRCGPLHDLSADATLIHIRS